MRPYRHFGDTRSAIQVCDRHCAELDSAQRMNSSRTARNRRSLLAGKQ